MELPILDGFYNSKCYLTAEKCVVNRNQFAKDYIAEHNIKTAILVFNRNLENEPEKFGQAVKIGELQSGEDFHGLYVIDNILLTLPFVGNPNASATLEELKALGIRNFLAAGSAGLIDEDFDDEKFLVVNRAIRDEGGSLHYEKPSLYAYTNEDVTLKILEVFNKKKIPYELGTTWTFDSFYKESKARIEKRLSEGATAVEMECATWCVVAEKLGLKFGQFLYFSDKVADGDWSRKGGDMDDHLNVKDNITFLCLEIAKKIDRENK